MKKASAEHRGLIQIEYQRQGNLGKQKTHLNFTTPCQFCQPLASGIHAFTLGNCVSTSKLYAHEAVSLADQQQQARQALARRYHLQNVAASLLQHERALQGCQKWVAYGKDKVTLSSYPSLKKGKIQGLQSCSSPWSCPVCSAKISARRCDMELTPALQTAKEKGWSVVMVTWTISHRASDRLDAMINALRVARKFSRSGRAWDKLRKLYGIVGSIRALEVTHGRNGWHPHFHELIFTDRKVDADQLRADLADQWDLGIAKAALPGVNEHGVKVSDTYKDVQEYVAKFGREPRWGVAEEMSRQQVKKARAAKGLSPFQLLGLVADADILPGLPSPARAAELFREYCAAMKGFRQLYWTPGLKGALGIADLSDEQIEALEADEKLREDFAVLTPPEWNCLRADGKHIEVNSLLAEGDKSALLELIAPYLKVLPTQRHLIDAETKQAFLLPLAPDEAQKMLRPVKSTRLRLDDPFADQRDRLPVVGLYRDPLMDRHQLVHHDQAVRLREMKAAGLGVFSLDEDAALLRSHQREVRAWAASWAVSRHDLPAAVLLRLLCLIATDFEPVEERSPGTWQGWGPERFTVLC